MVMKSISDKTVVLIFNHLSKADLALPLCMKDVEKLTDYFEMIEISLANDQSEGKPYDQEILNLSANAVDELIALEDGEYQDLDELNAHLKKLASESE